MGDLDRHRRAVTPAAAADKHDYGCRNDFPAFRPRDGRLVVVKSNSYRGSSYRSAAGEPSSSRRGPSPDPPVRRGRSAGGSMWCFSDPEMKRRRRIARYKSYAVEGKLKASIRKGFRWFSELVHGW